MDTYSWFAPGYRYAVLETVKIYQALPPNAPILQTAFYNATDDQANLLDDEENAAIRKAILKMILRIFMLLSEWGRLAHP